MKLLTYANFNTKKKIVKLYINQYSEKNIRQYLNDIIKDYRPKSSVFCRNVSLQEVKQFIELYGLPCGDFKFTTELIKK